MYSPFFSIIINYLLGSFKIPPVKNCAVSSLKKLMTDQKHTKIEIALLWYTFS